MGTTVTSTLAALGNLREDKAFNRSFAAATVHDFFNVFSILIFLPLEMIFHPLERAWRVTSLRISREPVMLPSGNSILSAQSRALSSMRDLVGLRPDEISGLVMILVGIAAVDGGGMAVVLIEKRRTRPEPKALQRAPPGRLPPPRRFARNQPLAAT